MSETALTPAESRSRKRKAILAGGIVLGLGASMTLAAWTDDVWVSSSFSAGRFNVQGAVDLAGTAWGEYNTSGGAGPLIFTVPVTAMSPGDSVFAPLNLRVDPTKNSYDAAITLPTAPSAPATGDANKAFFGALKVTLYNVTPSNCSSTGTSLATPLSGFNGVALGTTTTSPLLTLNKNSTPQGICFKISLPAGAPMTVQGGTTGALSWNFNATST